MIESFMSLPSVTAIVFVCLVLRFLFRLLPLFPRFLLVPLSLPPLLVIRVSCARAQNGEGAVRISASALDDQVAAIVRDAALVDGIVVGAATYLIPSSVFPAIHVLAIRRSARTPENHI